MQAEVPMHEPVAHAPWVTGCLLCVTCLLQLPRPWPVAGEKEPKDSGPLHLEQEVSWGFSANHQAIPK